MTLNIRIHQMLASPRLGGAESLAMDIQRFLATHRPGAGELLVPAGGDSERYAREENFQWRPYRRDRLLSSARLPWLAANADLFIKLARAPPGVLHVHSPFVYGALRPFLATTHLRTILHLHLDYTEEQLRWALRKPPDLVIVCARFMCERVAAALSGSPGVHTNVLTAMNAVDTSRFKPGDRRAARARYRISPDRLLLVMAANLAPHKGQETAIRAVSILRNRGIKPLLWLIGEERDPSGAYTADLRRLTASLELSECVEFLGFRRDVAALLEAADALLLPSTREGLPLVILEAQAAKVPVIAAPTAGIPEVVEHARTGYLVSADDPEGYARAVEALVRDPKSASEVVESAYRRVVSELGLGPYCARILGCYDELLGRHGMGMRVEP